VEQRKVNQSKAECSKVKVKQSKAEGSRVKSSIVK